MPSVSAQFGDVHQGVTYRDRPGAYGIAIRAPAAVLVVAVRDLLALPGGGLEAGERPEDCLAREYREETGYRVRILRFVGAAGRPALCRRRRPIRTRARRTRLLQ